MEQDKTQILKNIEQAELSFKALSWYAPNLELYRYVKEKITMPLIETLNLNPEVSSSSAILFFTDKFLSTPLEICTYIHLFSNEPLKVIDYVTRTLKVYEIKLGEFYLDLILKIINDPNRFQKQSPQFEYIKLELMDLQIEDIHKNNIETIEISAFKFFTDKDYYSDGKSLLKSFCEVRGWVMTEQQIVKDFIDKNESEILNQLSQKFNKYINMHNNWSVSSDITHHNTLLQSISANNDWDFYYNTRNISNQSFVLETEQYFETGARKGFLKPLEFMNLFWEQLQYFLNNAHKPYSTLQHFEALPLTAEQRHVLYCFILKYKGGYPLRVSSIDEEQIKTNLLLISEAFLRYRGDTPEKEYCRNIDLPKNLNDKLISLEPLPESYQYTGKDFEGFAAINDWDFYHNSDSIKLQEHVIFPIKKYFQTGERAGFIEPLAFMNLYWEQIEKLMKSENSTRSFTDSLKTLPINEEVRHVLYGWLLKYVGGYPYKKNNLWYDVIFIKIGDAFESYEGKTPEKWFCLREDEREKKINEGIAILDARIEKEKTGLIVTPQFQKTESSNVDHKDRLIIEKHLKPLNGCWNREKIMSDKEFNRLLEYVCLMVKNEEIPKNIEPIKQTKISTEFLRKTFQLLHFELYGKRKKDYWIDFLHITFIQFQSWERNTTKAHFKTYRSNYEKDKEKISC